MGDTRSPLDSYRPDWSGVTRTTENAPPPPTGFFEGIMAAGQAGTYRELQDAKERAALASGYAGIAEQLKRRGINGNWRARLAVNAFAMDWDPAALWEGIGQARARDPEAFKDLPATLDVYQAKTLAPVRAEFAPREERYANSGWVPWAIGTVGGSFSEPENLLGVAGAESMAAKTLAMRLKNGAVANARFAAMMEPVTAIDRAQHGEATGVKELALDIGGGAAFGVVAEGGIHFAAKGAKSIYGKSAEALRQAVPVDRRTPAEQAALSILDREDGIAAISPFSSNNGDAAHAQRFAEGMAAADAGALPIVPERRAAPIVDALNPAMAPRAALKAKIRGAESGGNDLAVPRDPKTGALLSSAFGRYQFTEGTWKRYYVRRFGRGALSDGEISAKRADPALQEALMDDLTADHAALLAKGGYRQTAGNLYLLHFAGEGGGMKILRAASDTPIEQVLGQRAVAANHFLAGKTTGDVVQWAHAKMGGPAPDGPVLDRKLFRDNDSWIAAQREVDIGEADRMAAELRERRAQARPDDGPEIDWSPWQAIDSAAEPATWQIEGPDLSTGSASTRWTGSEHLFEEMPAAERAARAAARAPVRRGPVDVITFLADRGGLANDEGHALSRGREVLRLGRDASGNVRRADGANWHQVLVGGSGPLVRKNGMSVDAAGELLWSAGYFSERPTPSDVLDLLDGAVRDRSRKVYPLHEQEFGDDIMRAAEQGEQAAYHEHMAEQLGIDPETEADLLDDVMRRIYAGDAPGTALEEAVYERAGAARGWLKDEGAEHGWEDDGFDAAFDGSSGDAGTGSGGRAVAGADAGGSAPGGGMDGAVRDSGLTDYADPVAGPGVERQTESIAHDIGAADRGQVFDYGDGERSGQTVGDVLDELDADASALAAAERCMAPPGAAA